jgi:hypothetical protein
LPLLDLLLFQQGRCWHVLYFWSHCNFSGCYNGYYVCPRPRA